MHAQPRSLAPCCVAVPAQKIITDTFAQLRKATHVSYSVHSPIFESHDYFCPVFTADTETV